MPTPFLKSLASKYGKSMSWLEKKWAALKHGIDRNYKYYWPTVVSRMKKLVSGGK